MLLAGDGLEWEVSLSPHTPVTEGIFSHDIIFASPDEGNMGLFIHIG
jgi:hypothetical protein